MTKFQQKIYDAVQRNGDVSVRGMAESLPGWSKRAARGVLVAHVRRAAQELQRMGKITFLPGRNQWEAGTIHKIRS